MERNSEGDFGKISIPVATSSGPTKTSVNLQGVLYNFVTPPPQQNQIQETAPKTGVNSNPSSSSFAAPSQPNADLVAGDPIADVRYGLSSVIGARDAMEDAAMAVIGFVTVRGERYDFYGVYDGHGGAEVAEVCKARMHMVVAEEVAAAAARGKGAEADWWRRVMERSFERVDAEVEGMGRNVGSTAVVAVVGPRLIVLANCGDSRAVMARNGEAIALSEDHKV